MIHTFYIYAHTLCTHAVPACPCSPTWGTQAKAVAAQQERYVLVDLLDWNEFRTLERNRDLWCKPEVKEVVRAHFVFLQVRRTPAAPPHGPRPRRQSHLPFLWGDGRVSTCPASRSHAYQRLTTQSLSLSLSVFVDDSWNAARPQENVLSSCTRPRRCRTRPSLIRGQVRCLLVPAHPLRSS
jgi:hypothetical protein